MKYYLVIICCFLAACGAGTSNEGQYSTLPVMTSVTSVQGTATTSFTLTANATDDIGVAGYCFSTSLAQPLVSDACFQTSNTKVLSLNTPLATYHVWAKDAFGHVSAAAKDWQPPCSDAGITASTASALNTVCVVTNLGEMVFELDAAHAPITVANFLKYVNDGFYTNTAFHRVVSNFMVQGGGYTYASSAFTAKAATYPAIALEPIATTGLSNLTGTIAMARTNVSNSATSGFFVNVADNTFLDTSGGGYATFGRLISGTATLTAIKSLPVVTSTVLSPEVSQPTTPPVIYWAVQLK